MSGILYSVFLTLQYYNLYMQLKTQQAKIRNQQYTLESTFEKVLNSVDDEQQILQDQQQQIDQLISEVYSFYIMMFSLMCRC